MAEHVGRRRRRRARAPPLVLETPPPTLIPEAVHTSPFKGVNTNSGEKLRKAPPGVPLYERTIYMVTEPYKSKTNELVNVGNREVARLLNLSGDERCASLFLQAKPRTRHLSNKILQTNERAQNFATTALAKSLEVEALGGKAIKVPGFFFKYPLL